MEDTIAAIATPLGEGGLAVIRISGPRAMEVADACFVPLGRRSRKPTAAASHTVHYGRLVRQKVVLDEVMVSVFRSPRSYTREDTVEISCHGGILCTKRVLDALLSEGARLAEPGEFTKRAFLNGRMDLTQAEAVADLIHSRTELALGAACEQLAGKLSERIGRLRDGLMAVLAHVEAHIDFPEEDIAPDTQSGMLARLERAARLVGELIETAREGQILRNGIRCAIVGRPNAGKSSLLNGVLGRDRAIVSPRPGTTRDTIEATASVRGIPVAFVDTAGWSRTTDEVELEGVRRSETSLAQADLVLYVVDASEPLHPEDRRRLEPVDSGNRILVQNKSDLPRRWTLPGLSSKESAVVSCRTGEGLEALKDRIKEKVWRGEVHGEMLEVMINSRHEDALKRTRDALRHTETALRDGQPLELVAVDLRIAVNAVGEIVGKTSTEDLLDSIFGQFCIGK